MSSVAEASGLRAMWVRYAEVLALPQTKRLMAAALIVRVARGMVSLAILLLVHDHTDSFLAAGVAVGAASLGSAATAPIQGAFVDRFGQTRVLLPACSIQFALLTLLVLAAEGGASAAVLVVLSGLSGMVVAPVPACLRTLWGDLTPNARVRESAFALEAVAQEMSWITGPLLTGVCIAIASPALAVLMVGVITVVGTVWFATAGASREWHGGEHERPRAGAMASVGMRWMLATIAFSGASWGAVGIGLPALAEHVGSEGSAGLLLACFSVGSMLGGIAYGARRWRMSLTRRYVVFLTLCGLLCMPLTLAESVPVAAVLTCLAGCAWAPALTCQFLLIGVAAPPGATTEAFTWNNAGFGLGLATGSAVGGAVEAIGIAMPFVAGCAAGLAAAAFALPASRLITAADEATQAAPATSRFPA